MARRRREPKEKKLRKVNFAPIEREHGGKLTEPYKVLEAMIAKHHKELNEAETRILIGWDLGPAKPDADGFLKFGRIRKGSDVDRACADYDVLLVIRKEIWQSFDATRKNAEIDRLLCRVAVNRDQHGEIVVDEKGRASYRMRKPVEVFPENVARFGFHQEPKLAECLTRYNDSQRPLLKENTGPKKRGKRSDEPALDPGELPPAAHMRNGNGKSAKPAPEPGSLEALDIPHPILEACAGADLRTVEDIVRYQSQYGELGLANLKGMGSEKAEALWATVSAYLEHHPELAEAK